MPAELNFRYRTKGFGAVRRVFRFRQNVRNCHVIQISADLVTNQSTNTTADSKPTNHDVPLSAHDFLDDPRSSVKDAIQRDGYDGRHRLLLYGNGVRGRAVHTATGNSAPSS